MADRILIVEDEEKLNRMIELELKYEGYETGKALDGRTGLDLALSGGYDLVLLEGFKDSGWPKIEVVRKEISDTPVSFQPLAVVGDIPGADFGLEDAQALADWLVAQMPGL